MPSALLKPLRKSPKKEQNTIFNRPLFKSRMKISILKEKKLFDNYRVGRVKLEE